MCECLSVCLCLCTCLCFSVCMCVYMWFNPRYSFSLKSTCQPGRAGGTFNLPLGATLTVPEGLLAKKDAITCTVVPPSQRWRHHVAFPGEHITSEIFVLSGAQTAQKVRLSAVSGKGGGEGVKCEEVAGGGGG